MFFYKRKILFFDAGNSLGHKKGIRRELLEYRTLIASKQANKNKHKNDDQKSFV